MAEKISTKYDGQKLSFQGHIYNHHKELGPEKTLYRCFNYKKFNCHGWAHLYVDGHVEITREHTFPCVPAPTEVGK